MTIMWFTQPEAIAASACPDREHLEAPPLTSMSIRRVGPNQIAHAMSATSKPSSASHAVRADRFLRRGRVEKNAP